MKIYGWTEDVCECCFGIETQDLGDNYIAAIDKDTKELDVKDKDSYSIEGTWFRTFRQAKTAQIEVFKFQIKWRKGAIAILRSQKKKDS